MTQVIGVEVFFELVLICKLTENYSYVCIATVCVLGVWGLSCFGVFTVIDLRPFGMLSSYCTSQTNCIKHWKKVLY